MTRWQSGAWGALAVGLISVAACSGDAAHVSRAERVEKTSQAATTLPVILPAPTTFTLTYPTGYGISRVPVGASQGVTLGLNDKVLATSGSPGTVTNSGAGFVNVGSGTSTGALVSVGNIVLLPLGVTATSAKSAGTVAVGAGDSVPTVVQHATLTPLAQRTMTVPALPGVAADFTAGPGSTTLAPGLYDDVNLLSGSTVTLTAGNYVIDDFVLSPLATLKLDTSLGTITVFVKSIALWQGQVTGDGTQFVFSYLGGLPLTFAGTFTGTALAPNAIINLGPLPSSYHGNFYGQQVVVASGVTVQEIATPLLGASLSVSNTTLCAGQPTEVTLDATDAGTGARTWINGIPGSHQFLQFQGAPGSRLVFASIVTPDGRTDFTSVPVTVQACTPAAGAPPPVALHFWPTPDHPNAVEFMVHDYDANGFEVTPSGSASYAWTFGDGQTATTTSPLTSHDYSGAVNPLNLYNYFNASVTVTTSSGSTTVQKVVPIFSVYADNRSRGIVQPPSSLSLSGSNLAVTVTNYETTPLSITSARVDLIPCDPSLDPQQQSATSLSVTVPASSSAAISIPQPAAFAPSICAIGAHVMGSATAGVVYGDAYGRVRENTLTHQLVTDAATIALLNQASAHTANPNQFDVEELRQLLAQGVLTQLPSAVPPGTTYQSVGDECTPGDVDNDLVCQPTADWVVNPGEILNASKGDFIIHHACGDMIANLLSAIHQDYSHSMTVSKNRVEVRHSTAAENRMTDAINYANEQLDGQKMQFGYPGTAGTTSYTIDQMVGGYCVPGSSDDSSGDSACPNVGWQMLGELQPHPSQCSSDVPIVYPLVLRPPPDATTAQLQAVEPVGDQALSITGHYRFFMYSRGDEFAPVTSGPSWANGTEESVCSLFDLESTRHAGSGGTALPLQRAAGAPPPAGLGGLPSPPDGMVNYSIATRTVAAQELFSNTYNTVESQTPPGWQTGIAGYVAGLIVQSTLTGGGILSGLSAPEITKLYIDSLAGSIGNQLVNCFATDGCGDTSGSWHNVGPGIAVSPDDIRQTWVRPGATTGGTYGYAEPAVYAPTSFRHKYTWQPKTGEAQMTVIVVDQNDVPVPDATIFLNSIPQGTTDSSGQLVISTVDQGTYELEAQDDVNPAITQPPPPPPPAMSASAISALPQCVSAPLTGFSSPCSVSGNGPSCPNLWSPECIISGTSTQVPDTNLYFFSETCACFAPPTPLTCDVADAKRTVSVPSSSPVEFELTMCITQGSGGTVSSGPCLNGVPQSCPLHCATDADCENTQKCSGGTCVARPRILSFQDTSELTVTQNGLPFGDGIFVKNFTFTCDPNGTQTAFQADCETYSGQSDEGDISIQCQEDASGGVVFNISASISQGCGSGASVQDTQTGTFSLPPPGPSNPTPSITLSNGDACYDTGAEEVYCGGCNDPCRFNFFAPILVVTSLPN
jgi:hypothetical protein